jgi:hypothetical protein
VVVSLAKTAKRVRFCTIWIAAWLLPPTIAHAGSARDYLNAPVDAWLATFGSGYSTSITPEDGTDIVLNASPIWTTASATSSLAEPRIQKRPWPGTG